MLRLHPVYQKNHSISLHSWKRRQNLPELWSGCSPFCEAFSLEDQRKENDLSPSWGRHQSLAKEHPLTLVLKLPEGLDSPGDPQHCRGLMACSIRCCLKCKSLTTCVLFLIDVQIDHLSSFSTSPKHHRHHVEGHIGNGQC